MKGCKLPQRPKKRAKLTQRTILVSLFTPNSKMCDPRIELLSFKYFLICFVQLVQPGTWLQDLCQERYEVREKKTSKKVLHLLSFITRPRVRSSKNELLYFWRIPHTFVSDPPNIHYFQRMQHALVSDASKVEQFIFGGSSHTHVKSFKNALLHFWQIALMPGP